MLRRRLLVLLALPVYSLHTPRGGRARRLRGRREGGRRQDGLGSDAARAAGRAPHAAGDEAQTTACVIGIFADHRVHEETHLLAIPCVKERTFWLRRTRQTYFLAAAYDKSIFWQPASVRARDMASTDRHAHQRRAVLRRTRPMRRWPN
eukprot:2276471-Pleurochrysis_carterae.AAC.1